MQHLVINDTATITSDTAANTITIKAGDSHTKLSDILSDFPDNCYVDKRITGCGGTTLVLRNEIEYVVLVPYVNLLLSKVDDNLSQHIIGVYSETDTDDLKAFLADTTRPRKIVCTFDSLPRLLGTTGFNPSEFKLLVDEAHTLINLGNFKAQVCEDVLLNYTQFKSHVFMTATPTKREYFPYALADMTLCTIEWDNVRAVKFNLQTLDHNTSLNSALFGLCFNYLTGRVEGNAHIFYNSVTEITTVLKKLKEVKHPTTGAYLFNPSDVRVVCSKVRQNQKVFNNQLGNEWANISDIRDQVGKVNFYTSTAFEGADVLDEEGQTYIIINGAKDNTKVDFHLLVPQIIGRVRNTKYNESINILVGNLPEAAACTREEWMKEVEFRISNSKDVLNDIKVANLSEAGRNSLIRVAEEDKYTFINKQGDLYVSDVAKKAELQAYEALEATYVVRAAEGSHAPTEGHSASFKDLLNDKTRHVEFAHKPTGIAKFLNGSTQCFSQTMKEYADARDANNEDLYILLDGKDTYFQNLYNHLGSVKLKALEYRRKDIDAAYQIAKKIVLAQATKTVASITNYQVGQAITKANIIKDLQAAYDELGIKKVAKSTDIKNYYNVKATKIRADHAFRII